MPWIELQDDNKRQVLPVEKGGWKPIPLSPETEDTYNQTLLKLARDFDPDTAAKAEQVSKKTGLPLYSLMRNPSLLKEAALKTQINFKPDAPKTKEFLKKPDNFIQAHDDIESLSRIEALGNELFTLRDEDKTGGLWKNVVKPAAQQIVRFGPFAGKSIYDTIGLVFGSMKYYADLMSKTPGNDFFFGNWSKALGYVTDWAHKNSQTMNRLMNQKALLPSKEIQEGHITEHPELLKKPEWWVYNTLGIGHYIALGAAGGAPALSLSFAGDMYDQLIREGASNDKALTAAYLFGIGAEALSSVGLDKYLKSVEGKTLFTRLAKRVINAIEGGTIATAFGPLSTVSRDLGLGTSLGKLGRDVKESVSESLDVFPVAFLTGAALHAPVQYMSAADRAEYTNTKLKQLNELAAYAKIKERNPDKFQEFLENIVSQDQNVFITPEGFKTLFQDSEVTDSVLDKLGISRSEAQAYAESQQDRDVPLSTFMAKLNPDEVNILQPHLKLHPSDISYAEAQNGEHIDDYQHVQNVLNQTYFNRLKERERFRNEVADAYNDEYADTITRLIDRWSLNFPEDIDIYKKIRIMKDPSIAEDKGAESFAQNFSVRLSDSFDEQMKAHQENGGSTFDANGRNMDGQPFLAFSLFKPLEVVTREPVTPESLKKYYIDHLDLFQKYPELTLGTWTNSETGETYYDISVLVPRDKKREALEFAKQAKQLEIYDLEARDSLKTGYDGSEGETPDLPVDEWMKLFYDRFPGKPKQLTQAAPMVVDGKVTAYHWSLEPNLKEIDPSYHGRGIKGAELKRKNDDPDHWVDRSYYGLDGYTREPGLGPHKYTIKIDADKLYDYANDPDGLLAAVREEVQKNPFANFASVYEQRIRDAGYLGYYVEHPSLGPVLAVFEKMKPEAYTLEETFNQEAFSALRPEEVADIINGLYKNIDLKYDGAYNDSLHSFTLHGDSKARGATITVDDPYNAYSVLQAVKAALKRFEDKPLPRKNPKYPVYWHGSGADFTRFSDEALLSGTGGMVFGAGHYVTEYDPVSKYYLHITGRFSYDGVEFTPDQLRTVENAKSLLTQKGFSEEEAKIAGRLLSYIAMQRGRDIKPLKPMLEDAINHWLDPVREGIKNIKKYLASDDAENVNYWREHLKNDKAKLARYEKEFREIASKIKTRRIQYKNVLRPGEKTWLNWYENTPKGIVEKINKGLRKYGLPEFETAFRFENIKSLNAKEAEALLEDIFQDAHDGVLISGNEEYFKVDSQFNWTSFDYSDQNYDRMNEILSGEYEDFYADDIKKMREEGKSEEEIQEYLEDVYRNEYGEIYDTGMIYPEIKDMDSVGAEEKYQDSGLLEGYIGQITIFPDRASAEIIFSDSTEEYLGDFPTFADAEVAIGEYVDKNIEGWVEWDNATQQYHHVTPQEMLGKLAASGYDVKRSGKQIYEDITDLFAKNPDIKEKFAKHTDVAASKFLNKEAGIDGIKYPVGTLGYRPRYDKFNYVIFDPDALAVVDKTYWQEGQKKLGSVTIHDTGYYVKLFKDANPSTLLHEMGHIFLNELEQLVRTEIATPEMVKDYNSLRQWLGLEDGEIIKTKHHEQFARGLELYFLEGKQVPKDVSGLAQRFHQWLKQIYTSVKLFKKQYKVNLNPEVEQIFDKFFGIEAETNEFAKTEQLLPKTKEELDAIGVLPGDRTILMNLYDSAIKKAEDRLFRARQKDYRGKLKKWREEATKYAREHDEIYQILDTLEKGKLDEESVREVFGDSALKKIPSKYIAKHSMFSVQDMALAFDKTPMELVEILKSGATKKERVEYYLDQRKSENDAKFNVMDFLLESPEYQTYMETIDRYLRGGVKEAVINRRIFRDVAKQSLENEPVRRAIRHDIFLRSFKKFQKNQREALLKKNFAKAAEANHQIRLAYTQAGEAVKNRRFLEKTLRLAKQLSKVKKNETLDLSWKYHIVEIAKNFGLVDSNKVPSLSVEELKTLDEILAGDEGLSRDPYFFDTSLLQKPIDYRDLTMGQLRDIYGLLRYLNKHGKKEKTLSTGEHVDDVGLALASESESLKGKKIFSKRHKWLRRMQDMAKAMYSYLDSFNFVMKAMGGYRSLGPKGELSLTEKYTNQRLQDAINRKAELLKAYHKKIIPSFNVLLKGQKRLAKEHGAKMVFKEAPVPEALKRNGQDFWTPEQIFALALHRGNESNMSRIFTGFPDMTPEHFDFLMGLLNKKEWDAIQKIWDTNDELFKLVNKVNKRKNGYEIASIPPKPFRTAFGVYRGGYTPVAYDRELARLSSKTSRITELYAKEDVWERAESIFQTPAAKSRFNNPRVAKTVYPLLLSLQPQLRHIVDTIHYATHAEVLRDVDMLIRQPDFRDAVIRHLGPDVYEQLRPALHYIARPELVSVDPRGDRGMLRLKNLLTSYILAFNPSVALKQVFSLPSAGVELGKTRLIGGIAKTYLNPITIKKRYDFMIQNSPYMRDRMARSFDREFGDLFNKLDANTKKLFVGDNKIYTWDDVVKVGFAPIRAMDIAAVLPIWTTAYEKAIQEGRPQKDSVAYADRIVRETQPSAQSIDLVRLQREGGWKIFISMFSTYTLGKYQQRARTYWRAWKSGKIGAAKYADHLMFDQLLPALGMVTLFHILKGGTISSIEDTKEILEKAGNQLISVLIPIIGSWFSGYGANIPFFSVANDLISSSRRVVKDVKNVNKYKGVEKLTKDAWWAMLEYASVMSKLPVTQIIRRVKKGQKGYKKTGKVSAFIAGGKR